MNFRNLLAGLFFFASSFVIAAPSASRLPDEKFTVARARHVPTQPQNMNIPAGSAWGVAVRYEKLDFSKVTDIGSLEKLNRIFAYIRDSKFINKQTGSISTRRLSWLFPDDGCYVRAGLASHFLNKQSVPDTQKLFAFGDLAVKSNNHPDGVVRWWYHVVPIYRVGNQGYVIDPSIDPRGPMLAEEWKKAMEINVPAEKFAICKTQIVSPEDNCSNPRGQSYESLIREQQGFLDQEWTRVQSLGRNPQQELGDSPPWK